MNQKYCLPLFLIFTCFQSAHAAGVGWFNSHDSHFGLVYTEYSGERFESFSSATSAYGLEFTGTVSNRFVGFHGGVGAGTISGQETLQDGSTERTLAISGYYTNAHLGFQLNLVPGKEFRLRPYLGAYGLVEFNYIRLPSETTYDELATTTSDLSLGYVLAFGVAFKSELNSRKAWDLTFETRFRALETSIFDQDPFSLGGISFVLGFGY
ncbi:MAG: hypothetical protein ACK5RO_07350 [Pseudobdellovibrionaceae bacterium]